MNKTPLWLRAEELVQNHPHIDEALHAFQNDPTSDNAVGLVGTVIEKMVPPGWKLVPSKPTEAQWGGLARDIMMAFDLGALTPRKLLEHLERVGDVPDWLRAEGEMRNLDHVISKGTRCVLIHRAMVEAAPSVTP